MAKSTAKVATKAQQEAAEQEARSMFDNMIKGHDFPKLFRHAMESEIAGDKLKASAEQEMAFVCLLTYESIYGTTPARRREMGKLSRDVVGQDGKFDSKPRIIFINEVCAAVGIQHPSMITYANSEDKAIATRKWNMHRQLIGRGLDFACDLIESGAQSELAGTVATYYDEDKGVFVMPWQSFISADATPHYRLHDLIYGNDKVKPMIKGDENLRIAFDNHQTYTQWNKDGKAEDFICNAPRVRVVAKTKRVDQRKPGDTIRTSTNPASTGGAQGGQQTTGQRPGNTPAPTPAPTPGRPQGSGNEKIVPALIPNTFPTLLKALFDILSTVRNDEAPRGKPSEGFWSTMPDRALIESVERQLRTMRELAQAYELRHTQATTAKPANKTTLPPLASLQTPPGISELPSQTTVKSSNG